MKWREKNAQFWILKGVSVFSPIDFVQFPFDVITAASLLKSISTSFSHLEAHHKLVPNLGMDFV